MTQTFGEHIRAHRRIRGWSQRELARRCDLDPKSIRQLEESWTFNPHGETFVKLADALGVGRVDVFMAWLDWREAVK